jgi:hypothetical protein
VVLGAECFGIGIVSFLDHQVANLEIYMASIVGLILFIYSAVATTTSPRKFVHPGVVVDQKQLTYIRENLAQEPFTTAFHKALNSDLGSIDYKPKGPPPSGVIECGGYSKPDHGCSAEDSDASAAVLQLLLFALTNKTNYADNAVAILDKYGASLKRYNNSNAPLQAAWGASKWGRAAELAKHLPHVGWSQTGVASFENMLRTVTLPLIHAGSPSNGNWELSMISGMMGIAVFLDDGQLFDHAVEYWRQRVGGHFASIWAELSRGATDTNLLALFLSGPRCLLTSTRT